MIKVCNVFARKLATSPAFLFLLVFTCSGFGQEKAESDAYYIPMKDGIRIAADVHYPSDFDESKKYPAVIEYTRYWRSAISLRSGKVIRALNAVDRKLLENGYVVVKVDARGSGASFGTRQEEYGPAEVKDGYAIIDWIAKRPWSNGKVGAKGVSYTGTTAELLCASNHPALKAVIPGWSDFDVYESPARPYGLFPAKFLGQWGAMVGYMDSNDRSKMRSSIRPVDPKLIDQAISDHKNNPNVFEIVAQSDFKDVGVGKSAALTKCTSRHWRKQIEKSNVAMLVFASWLDAGTADGALLRFQNYSNPQNVVILASNHGGSSHASPMVVRGSIERPIPAYAKQIQMRIDFFDFHLKGKKNEVPQWPRLQYFNMGQEKLLSTDTWPPRNTSQRRFYFAANGKLSQNMPESDKGKDLYKVDFRVSTGQTNRWMTQMGGPVLNLHRRNKMDDKMLTYTTEPLAEAVQITGWPQVNLQMNSDHADGAVIAYLEVVAPESEESASRYISEGGLRLIHRKVSKDPDFPKNRLFHSFSKADSSLLPKGTPQSVAFKMWPTSVRVPKGYRIRIAIAGHDASVFQRVPEKSTPILTVYRNRNQASFVEIPLQK